VWALGVTLYYLSELKEPFYVEGDNAPTEVDRRIRNTMLKKIENYSDELNDLIDALL
jgi:hypothetical protein